MTKQPPPDPVLGLLDEIADNGVATVGVLDEGLRGLVRALNGVQRIEGRDGRDGRNGLDGRNGRDGESIVTFRTGYDSLSAPTRDGLASFVGHAVHGTPEHEPGWWIERLPGPPIKQFYVFVVELPEGVQDGRLRWTDRESYSYVRSEFATLRMRRALADLIIEMPEAYLAVLADVGFPAAAIAELRYLIATWPDEFAARIECGDEEPATHIRAAERLMAKQPWYPAYSPVQRAELMRQVRKTYVDRYAASA